MRTTGENEATVTIGHGVVTIKRSGSSKLVVANVLGSEDDGKMRIVYLDRLVHGSGESELGPFEVYGAISSCLRGETVLFPPSAEARLGVTSPPAKLPNTA